MQHSLRHLVALLALSGMAVSLVGCGGSGPRVTRTEASQQVDLSGNWNATDSMQVANTMIAEVMTRPWHTSFRTANQRNPRVQVHRVIVRGTGDVIDTQIFTNDIVREFINSGLVDAFSATDERDDTREVLADQDVHASAATRSEAFQETGSDFILRGTILVQDDQAGRTRQRFYQVDLNLTNIQTQQMVWMGSHRISKIVERRR